jgi:hypothetical protein
MIRNLEGLDRWESSRNDPVQFLGQQIYKNLRPTYPVADTDIPMNILATVFPASGASWHLCWVIKGQHAEDFDRKMTIRCEIDSNPWMIFTP